MSPHPDSTAVVDVGGTTLRVATGTDGVRPPSRVHRVRTAGLESAPHAPVDVLQKRVVDQIVHEVRELCPGSLERVGIAFAGPVTADGLVTAAPTVWGEGGLPLPLGELVEERLQVPVTVVNDLTAAAWRYSAVEREPFCLWTVSSGIGNKVFRDGGVLVHPDGHGGEMGHWVCDTSAEAPLCNCGARGHLGALSSGRGVLASARGEAARRPEAFASSGLGDLCRSGPDSIDNPALVTAVHAGDPFSVGILRNSLAHLASAVGAVFTSTGVRRHVIIGGFALAVGKPYRDLLVEELSRQGCFGVDTTEIGTMVSLGCEDDAHSLVGMARILEERR
ncbi:ROK family protein [Nocardiopsis halotolerans]|uniref:ROK family protein n=1 Tax=Nocardiopsis halotolerans TaxID=124252 RepID=UPI000345A8EF|nr:ROK family protein [Nocardiopsis halotolerans]